DLVSDLKLVIKKQIVIIDSAPTTLDPLVTEELDRLGIDPVATIPLDEEIYEYDLKLKSLLDLPDTSKAVIAVNDLMIKLLSKN
ncbi:unnamed protein product, partial [marine sediment metagenome]